MLLNDPIKVEVTPPATTVDLIRQSVYYTEKHNKQSLLIHLLREQSIETVLVFTQMKYGADKLTRSLNSAGIRSEAIHGNKAQAARQKALNNFKNKQIRVLVATDIAARGIDIDELAHVINYDLPNIPETYVHRIGRTGRAGASGTAISFCDWSEKMYLSDIQKLTRKKIDTIKGHLYDVPSMHDVIHSPSNPGFTNSRGYGGMKRKHSRAFTQGS